MNTAGRVDIVGFDGQGEPAVLVEVKAKALGNAVAVQQAEAQLAEYLRLMPTAPYAMLVDSREVRIYRWDGERLVGPAFTLDTAQALAPYEPDYGLKPIYEYYLIGLVEAWLRDIAYRWKLPMPPYTEQMSEIGLVEHLTGGTTRSEAILAV